MKTIADIVADIDEIELRRGDPATPIEAVSSDSRAVKEGGLFVALSGHHFDGHDFLDAAVNAGVSAVLVDKGRQAPSEVAVLETANAWSVLGLLGRSFYDNPTRQMKVIGITGTNGKTSTTYLLRSICVAAGWNPGIIGTIEYRWADRRVKAPNTTPDGLVLQRTLRTMVDDGVDVAILEVSSHGLEQGRVKGVEFDAGIFTNLSHDHVEFHGSVEAYRRAKWRLFEEYLPASANGKESSPVAVVNAGHREGRKLLSALTGNPHLEVVSHGWKEAKAIDEVDHFRGTDLRLELAGVAVQVEEPDGRRYELGVSMPGEFNAENMLSAAVCARRLGVSVEDVRRGLAQAEGVPGRMERVGDIDTQPAVFVDYAHSPDALEKVLKTLRGVAKGRLWVVFGCGGDRDRSKRGPMGAVAARWADRIVVTSDNPRSEDPEAIVDSVVEGIEEELGPSGSSMDKKWWRQVDREQAIVDAILRARPEDVILVAGKGHETTQERAGQLKKFDDRLVASRALRRRGVG